VASNHSITKLGINEDFALQLARGEIEGHSVVNKFGQNSAIADGTTEEVWDGSAAYVFPTSAVITKVSQTTDQAALQGGTIEVQGLDANWDLVVQNVDLNASDTETPVTLTTPLIRVFRMKVQENVVSTSPIRAHNDAENQDYAIIQTGNNQTLMAIYTVPAGHTAYMTRYYTTIDAGVGNPTSFTVRLWAADRHNGYAKQIKHLASMDPDQAVIWNHPFFPYYRFTQKTDIYLTATPTGAAGNISGGFDLIIIQDS
jgi:hypothetical protein